jgi:hypothetical protein
MSYNRKTSSSYDALSPLSINGNEHAHETSISMYFFNDNNSPYASNSIEQADTLKVLANCILQNPLFKIFYLLAVLLSIITLVISFVYRCPPPIFFFLEAVVNGLMIIEVLARFAANTRLFWNSFWNKLDSVLVVLSVITLGLIIFGHEQCHVGEADPAAQKVEIFEQVILICRNGLALSRSLSLIQRYV